MEDSKKSTTQITSISNIRNTLLKLESVNEWKKEIENILTGQRDGYLNQQRNIKMYIETDLFPSLEDNREKFNTTYKLFINALENVVQEWNPSIKREKEFFACMLELIQVYAPQNKGLERVWEFLEVWENRIDEIPTFGGYNSEKNLIQESLFSLNKFFIFPLNVKDKNYPRYKRYIDVLKKYLFIPEYCGYSAIRLIELNEYNLKDDIFRKVIEKNPSVFEDLVSYIFSPDERSDFKINLTTICNHAFNAGENAVLFLDKVLSLFDAEIVYEQINPTIQLANGDRISIDLHKVNVTNYQILKSNIKTSEIVSEITIVEREWEFSSTKDIVNTAKKALAAEASSYTSIQINNND